MTTNSASPVKTPGTSRSLREDRCAFTVALCDLVRWAVEHGYEVALDEVTERLTAKDPTSDHRPGSLHHSGLAADLLLYLKGDYLTKTEDYYTLGVHWEALGELRNLPLRWGGRFSQPDGNHFSLERGGFK